MERQDAFPNHDEGPLAAWCRRHYRLAALAILALAAVNLGYRLGSEVVTEWDESLYALTAWDVLENDRWIATTFHGHIDYYNSKPPLNVWLIALAFKLFGPGLIPLRLMSAIAAWLTVAVLQVWLRRAVGPAVSLGTSLVLSTAFGFLYVHSGRSGNPDALFALLVLLTVITLWSARHTPQHRIWLGPIMAGAFLLKGPGVLLPFAIVVVVEWIGRHEDSLRWRHAAAAAALFVVPVGAWAFARWQEDGLLFFNAMFFNDLIAISLEPTDGHAGGPFYYLGVLQKNQYAWLLVAVVAAALAFRSRHHWREARATLRQSSLSRPVLAWAAVALLIPTAMATKLPWYLNSFYPVFALAVAALFVHAWTTLERTGQHQRRRLLAGVAVTALIASQAQLVWYSHRMRDLEEHVQGVILAGRSSVAGSRVFGESWNNADLFVLKAVHAGADVATGVDDFLLKSQTGDYLVGTAGVDHPALVPVLHRANHALYQRRD